MEAPMGVWTLLQGLKKKRRTETWKKIVAKVKRTRGEVYISPSTGKEVEVRKTGLPCRCKRKYFDQFTTEEKEGIIKG